jgi:AcrR family transcriptional regulator
MSASSESGETAARREADDRRPVTRHRRRGEQLESAILGAAWEQLSIVGYQALSMDRVAAKAGTSKAVLYRRWPNRAQLVLAALRWHRPMLSAAPPDTGSLRDDVLTLLRRVSAGVAEIGQETVFGLLDELSADPEGLAYLHAQHAGNEAMGAILRAAAKRGELRLERIPARVASLPVDLARHELLVRRAPVPGEVIVEIVDDVFLPLVRNVH